MKIKFLISFLLLLVTLPAYTQSTNKLPTIPYFFKKGIITLNNGSPIYYKNLQLHNDSIYYQDYNLIAKITALQDISHITKTGSCAGLGAVSGCGLGLLLGIRMAKAIDNAGDFVSDVFTLGEKPKMDTREEETSTIILSTVIGTGLGALIGSLISKNRIVFSSPNMSISFSPSYKMDASPAPEFALTCLINFH